MKYKLKYYCKSVFRKFLTNY